MPKSAVFPYGITLRVKIAGNNLVLPVVFLESETAPRVLGREGLFNAFTIVFDEHRQRSGLLGEGTKEQHKVGKILDGSKSK